ncbi:hypothetical protein P3W24_03520 [Luteibacter sp. PPL201]|uniref:Chitin-binding type-2 domain-containing protein n=1 Tax=Luteibacter sahnii TaxID=3021977 RepID=A0ABT6B7V0_9GAMM|nr:hypothetical protein [Luteibacter sp. PPL193]MDY1548006.1 hypothetical protein [Luteibacter sp. PPL193]
MKRSSLFFFLCMMFSAGANAGKGYYQYIPYYNNDPFTFCTYGVPEDCWVPLDKTRGLYTVVNWYCFKPFSATLFSQVCPHAFEYMYRPTTTSMTQDPANADS